MSKDQGKSYSAGVKEYRETYWMPEYVPKDTDFLACFKITPQEGEDGHAGEGAQDGGEGPRGAGGAASASVGSEGAL